MAVRPCRFHQSTAGCRLGTRCNFAHTSPNSAAPADSPRSPGPSTRSRGNNPRSPPNSPNALTSVPNGVCRFYWTHGNCKREFECRFRHTTPDAVQEAPQSPPRLNFASNAAREIIAPFLTEKGLAKINGTSTDGFFPGTDATSLSPTDAHGRLKRFLQDNFKFKTSFEVYAFLLPLCSANSSNTLWTQEEGQLLLGSIASTNGSLRIVEIINWPEITTRAGQDRTVLSFQRGVLPLLRYMSSEFVIKSTLVTQANHLYTIVLQNLPRFADVVESCMEQAVRAQSFKDPTATSVYESLDAQVFASIAGVLHEFLVRFKNAVVNFPRLAQLVTNLCQWFRDWHDAINANPSAFNSPFKNLQPAVRDLIVGSIKEKVDRLASIIEREQEKLSGPKKKKDRKGISNLDAPHEALVAALHTTYQGPGHHRVGGPRHDNDFEDIFEIRIAPTNDELMNREPPFLPANFFSAPHHAPPGSMQRLLDIQFRLLREELIAPLRKAVQLVHDDLQATQVKKTKLAELLQKQGGRYRGMVDTQESLMFNVYTGVRFVSLVPDWKGISTSLVIDTPPGRARSDRAGKRASFWESMSGKRLSQGGLIALVWESGRKTAVHLGVIANSSKEITEYVRQDEHHVKLRIVFFDTKLELRVLQELRNSGSQNAKDVKLLVESPVMFEAIRPFLEALQTEPEDIPFSRYLVHQPPGQLSTVNLDPPRYSRLPNFEFQLASLFSPEAGIDDLKLSVTDPRSIEHARTLLRRSRLDPSQADAVLDTLTREVALIQGPPGTGKSFTGVEILRVLQANRVGPILMIAFTNHALDHMLCSVLDAHITNKIVRLGRRASDERIAKYSIETLEMAQKHSRLDRAFHSRRDLKDVQEHITKLMNQVLHLNLENDSAEILKYLSTSYPEHHDYFSSPPLWLSNIRILTDDQDADAGEWQKAGPKGKARAQDNSNYAFWKECTDLTFIDQVTNGTYTLPGQVSEEKQASQNAFSVLTVDSVEEDLQSESDSESDDLITADALGVEELWKTAQYDARPDADTLQEPPLGSSIPPPGPVNTNVSRDAPLQPADFHDMEGFFASLGFYETPCVPCTDRPLEELLENVGDVWTMSANERRRIHKFWVDNTRTELGYSSMNEFERLRSLHAEKLREVNEMKEEVRRTLLENIDIIGCTTTGAAQLTTLLKGLSPKVLLVEEAGQVMEAHILGSLVPSIEHLILIGDPFQLRPTLNNYSLSMDSKRGRALYKFDMSLMERLSDSGLAMSRIDVQRRMRPTISSLIRNTLYPGLVDHELVRGYPDVQGVQQNVFFVTHTHKENDGGDETASKYNTYEVAMICDLVLYLLRQGCYSDEGDIVVLCAYLGQLARLRDALASEVAIIIDERDQAALDDQESDNDQRAQGEVSVERVNVTKRVRLRTVDNYQGEEGRIVILSLVRNAGGLDDEMEGPNLSTGIRPTGIGFLKSENRTNVALSRAREGLFIFGNADNLSSRSKMWRSIIEELEGIGCVGPALPIACHRHPDTVELISKPGVLPQIAPDGGCLRACETRLKCGHLCPFKCHCDDPNHVTVVCSQPCRRLCPRDHPCRKLCSTPCGDCIFPIANVTLPCGHVKAYVECHKLDNLETIYCDFEMEKTLPTCEHTAFMACGQDPSTHHCVARCGLTMGCCSKNCSARCHECQSENVLPTGGNTIRREHRSHRCEKSLHCGHRCQEDCSTDHQHTTNCLEKCRQSCIHAECRSPCSTPCAPCKESCAWNCVHHTCPVPCGSICVRLPCDQPCTNMLFCGHRCPSVCGENCAVQVCPECAPANKKDQVVDLILSRTLSDVMPELGGLDELLITIPSCGHVFTVETLDGHTGINDFYSRDAQDTKWTGLRAPSGFVKPPTCPSCRSSIACNRYGRIIKRADLDILERNVASSMFQSLDRWQSTAQRFDVNRSTALLVEAASTVVIPVPKKTPLKKQKNARDNVLKATKETPVSETHVRAENVNLHCIESAVTTIWRKATHPLFSSYREIVKIAETRSAHTQAWEAAFSFLHEREIEAGLKDPARMPRRPEEHAMRMARLQVGQPRPLADRRVLVEAFWASIHIRLTIIRLAQTWLDESSKDQGRCPPFHRQQWATYIAYLLQTCRMDTEKALKVAEDSRSHRQIIKSVLLCMRINLEEFRFNLDMSKKSGALKDPDVRKALCDKAVEQGRETEETMRSAIKAHFARKEIGSRQEEAEWVDANFTTIARTMIDEWSEIERSIRLDTFYEPVSLEEKMEIIRAFGFGSTGHFYTCQNGHIFAITECGGAMERSRCPECGAVIGGANHHLDQSNQRATEFEDLARRANPNVAPNPWANPY